MTTKNQRAIQAIVRARTELDVARTYLAGDDYARALLGDLIGKLYDAENTIDQ